MDIQLNHTIVRVRDRSASAEFYRDILGLPERGIYGPFAVLPFDNGITLLVLEVPEVLQHHYAFLVSEERFDAVFDRIRARGLTHWADHTMEHEGEINRNDGGRGVYWQDPDGHVLEMITRPYGGLEEGGR